MPDLRADAELVTAHLAGDRSALAEMYDRYGAGLYDTAAAILRDRHEAADAAHDVFLVAAEKLGQLRDATRLKPWLYAVLRNEVYRRSRRRGRALPTDFSAMGVPELAAPTAPDAEGEMVAAGELAELVRSAACGLDERDQLVLELSVRQGLQGADLALALGVSPEQGYTLVHRMRGRVERSLGALTVARAGRDDCAVLDTILRGWDGTFDVLIRKRVARHIEQCEICERTRRKVLPLALLGAAPAFAAPVDLRDRILGHAAAPAGAMASATFDMPGGFPRVVRGPGRWLVAAGIAVVVLLAAGGVAVVAAGRHSTGDDIGSRSSTTFEVSPPGPTVPVTAPGLTPTTGTPSTGTSPTGTSTTSTSPTGTSTTGASSSSGSVAVSVSNIDLGTDTTSATFDVTNTGGVAVQWSTGGSAVPFVLVGSSGTLAPGAHQVVTVLLDRTDLPEGKVQATVSVHATNGPAHQITLRGDVERPPTVKLRGPTGSYPACQVGSALQVTAFFTDDTGVTAPLTMQWTGPEHGDVTLTTTSTGVASGSLLLPVPTPGTYTYVVTVTDVAGNTSTVTSTFVLTAC